VLPDKTFDRKSERSEGPYMDYFHCICSQICVYDTGMITDSVMKIFAMIHI